MGQGRVTRSEVVQRKPHAELAELEHRLARLRGIPHHARLGDLQDEERGVEAGVLEDGGDVVAQQRVGKLGRREVHGELEPGAAGVDPLPVAHLTARDREHRPADARHQARLVRDADEAFGLRQRMAGPVPAGQRLDRHELLRFEIDDRLVVHLDLVPLDRLLESDHELVPRPDTVEHPPVEARERALPVTLGLVHRQIGIPEDLLRGYATRQPVGDPDAGAHAHVPAGDSEGTIERVDQAHGDALSVIGIDTADENGELVTTEPGSEIDRADRGRDTAGDRDQELVAGLVAEHVVDDLEVVEVEEQDGNRRVLIGLGQRLADLLREQRPVGQTRERVVVGAMAQLVPHRREITDGAFEPVGLELSSKPLGDHGQPMAILTAHAPAVATDDEHPDHLACISRDRDRRPVARGREGRAPPRASASPRARSRARSPTRLTSVRSRLYVAGRFTCRRSDGALRGALGGTHATRLRFTEDDDHKIGIERPPHGRQRLGEPVGRLGQERGPHVCVPLDPSAERPSDNGDPDRGERNQREPYYLDDDDSD